jgi:hypothetical protein
MKTEASLEQAVLMKITAQNRLTLAKHSVRLFCHHVDFPAFSKLITVDMQASQRRVLMSFRANGSIYP